MGLLQAEFVVTAVSSFGFLALFLRHISRQRDRVMAIHLAVFTLATGTEATALFAATQRVLIPLWLFTAIFGLVSVVAVWRLGLYVWPMVRRQRIKVEERD